MVNYRYMADAVTDIAAEMKHAQFNNDEGYPPCDRCKLERAATALVELANENEKLRARLNTKTEPLITPPPGYPARWEMGDATVPFDDVVNTEADRG